MATLAHRAGPPPAKARAPRRPWARLLAEVLALGEGRGELLRHAERPWASVTFSGTRHSLALRFAGLEAVEAGERLIDALPEHEFTLPGQLVADAVITAVSLDALPQPVLVVEAELLLLEDR
ncbi:MAG: hypothetical protein JSS36_12215 [Proteobacteria bacterium]|nr:hypothetical protein [Pseudomonadota bacterium]